MIQQVNILYAFSYSVTMIIALLSLYESYSNRRKFNQLNKETLVSKVAIDFDYKVEQTDQSKIIKGKITFQNKGSTNIKLTEVYFDVKDRSDELRSAFIPNTPDEPYSTIVEGVKSIDLIGFNNSRLLSFTNPLDKYFEVYRKDSAYEIPEEGKVQDFDLDKNIHDYIVRNVNEVYDLFKNFDQNREKIIQKLIGDLLIREIRGFQLFPGESLTQEFVASYKGSGTLILNVEASSLRFLQRSITKGEEYKDLVDVSVNAKTMDETTKTKMIEVLDEGLKPSNKDIMDHRRTFLMYLP